MTEPFPETLTSIKKNGMYGDGSWRCGCDERGPRHRWNLCSYHEGFDDALSVVDHQIDLDTEVTP